MAFKTQWDNWVPPTAKTAKTVAACEAKASIGTAKTDKINSGSSGSLFLAKEEPLVEKEMDQAFSTAKTKIEVYARLLQVSFEGEAFPEIRKNISEVEPLLEAVWLECREGKSSLREFHKLLAQWSQLNHSLVDALSGRAAR